MTPNQQGILDHLQARPGRMAYLVGRSPNYNHIGRWTASYPHPRIWFALEDITTLRRFGHLLPWQGHEDALVLASH